MRKILLLLLFTMMLTISGKADIRMPDTPKPTAKKRSVEVRMNIVLSKNTDKPTLSIPKSALKELRAQLEDLDNDSDANTALNSGGSSFSRTQTIIGGIFLSLGMIFGGVWFARSQKSSSKNGKIVAAGAILFFVASMTTIVFANVGPPVVLRSITSKLFDKKVFGTRNRRAFGNVMLELTNEDEDSEVQFVVPDKDDSAE